MQAREILGKILFREKNMAFFIAELGQRRIANSYKRESNKMSLDKMTYQLRCGRTQKKDGFSG